MLSGRFFVLLLGSLFCCGLSNACPSVNLPTGCNYDCDTAKLVCQHTSWPERTVALSINQCTDPLEVNLQVIIEGTQTNLTRQYLVGGPNEVSSCWGNDGIKIHTTYSRNTTHLTFKALGVVSGDIAIGLIPSVTLPLTPHTCMCQSLQTVADNFRFDIPFPIALNYNCTRDENCTSVQCLFSAPFEVPITIIIDPCNEAIILSNNNSMADQSELVVFNRTEDRLFQEDGNDLTVHMTLTNHNYSMEFSTSISLPMLGPSRITIFEPTKVILDRSVCSSDIAYYPGDEIPVSICSGNPSTGGTPLPVTTISSPVTTISSPLTDHKPTTLKHTDKPPTTSSVSTTASPITCPGLNVPYNCQPLSNCSGISCSADYVNAVIVVDKCSDPVVVELTVSDLNSSTIVFLKARYFVGGPQSYYNHGFYVYYERNSSHLQFFAGGTYEGDIGYSVISAVDFPLDPHSCMCESLDTIVANSVLPKISPVSLNCTRDQSCSSVDCVLTFASVQHVIISMMLQSCHEAVIVSQQAKVEVFNMTDDRPFIISGGPSGTLNVVLANFNFSMDLKMGFTSDPQTQYLALLPMTRVALDRSKCLGEDLKFYPGSAPEPVILAYSTPPGSGFYGSYSIIILPCLIIISIVIIVTVCVCVGVALRRRRRRRRVGQYTFRELQSDHDDVET